jgi:hypothetical protein
MKPGWRSPHSQLCMHPIDSCGIAPRAAEGPVVKPQLGQRLAALEAEGLDDEAAGVSLRCGGEEQEESRAHTR